MFPDERYLREPKDFHRFWRKNPQTTSLWYWQSISSCCPEVVHSWRCFQTKLGHFAFSATELCSTLWTRVLVFGGWIHQCRPHWKVLVWESRTKGRSLKESTRCSRPCPKILIEHEYNFTRILGISKGRNCYWIDISVTKWPSCWWDEPFIFNYRKLWRILSEPLIHYILNRLSESILKAVRCIRAD